MQPKSKKVITKKEKVELVISEVIHVPLMPLVHSQYAENFQKCVQGYHFINSEPLNETVWETVNSQVLMVSGCEVQNTSSGSHSSGRDIVCALGGISNKSAKYSKGKTEFSISSYRLTTVCSDKDCGNVEAIVNQINSRKNYEWYSFIVRNETDAAFDYDWYMIPSGEPILSPESYTWEPVYGQRGKNSGQQIGWQTNELNGSQMTIRFSMSSQLWISIKVTEDLKKYIVSSCTVSRQAKFNYLQIYQMFNK
jgi:hypothetical protein